MTNEQLAVLLGGYLDRLSDTLDAAREELVENGVRRHVMRRYVGDKTGFLSHFDTNPDHWEGVEAPDSRIIALDKLWELHAALQSDIDELHGKGGSGWQKVKIA